MAEIKFLNHVEILARWNLDPRVEPRVSNSRLHILATNITSKNVKVDVNFLRFLCGTYNTDKSTFCIGQKEIYLGLEDILYITGLPISGYVVAADCSNVKSDCQTYLGIQVTTLDLKLSYLLDNFQRVPNGTSEADLEKYIRAYYLFVIGCIIVPKLSKGTVPVEYLCMMRHTDKIDQYAWGSAMLTCLHAFFHRNIHRPTESKQFYGSPLILQIFALIRLPQLWRHYGLSDPPQRFPLVQGWVEIMQRKSMDNSSRIDYSTLLGDNVQVKMKPYVNVVGVPSFVIEQFPLSFGQMHLICLNMAWLYNSHSCKEQVQRTVRTIKSVFKFKHKSRGASSAGNWIEYHEKYIAEWKKVHDTLSLHLESPIEDDDDYEEEEEEEEEEEGVVEFYEEMEHEQSTVASERVWGSVKMYTVQCAKCRKWRLTPTKEKYEEIRERILDEPFICETARVWRPNASCEDESDVKQDGSMCWAMDKPNIPCTPSGWQRIHRVSAEGDNMFSDIYYVAPCNKRLYSMVELDRYLAEHPRYQQEGVSISQFSFQPPVPLDDNYVAKHRALSPSVPNQDGALWRQSNSVEKLLQRGIWADNAVKRDSKTT